MKTSGGDLVSLGRTQPAPIALHWGRTSTTAYIDRPPSRHPGSGSQHWTLLCFWPRTLVPLQETCCVIRLCCRLCPDDAMGVQQKGLKRLRKASATFSLGSPSEILLVGYPSGVHYTWPSQGARAAGRPAGSSPYPLASAVPKFATPSHRADKIRRRQRAPDSLGGLSLGHQFVCGLFLECLGKVYRCYGICTICSPAARVIS